ncbi:MAG: hypothetical protein K8823_141 [Cenarchaeum symbiont of Oopsacas minuta]|nr:hypothetical protein [Cenarchaeum symbiont of Oopsacas minuta]
MSDIEEILVKITSAGTVTVPKQLRKHMDMQKGDYVKIYLEGDSLVVKKATIT